MNIVASLEFDLTKNVSVWLVSGSVDLMYGDVDYLMYGDVDYLM